MAERMTSDELRGWRLRHGWTQHEAAEQVGVSFSAFQSWECGYRPIPNVIQRCTTLIDVLEEIVQDFGYEDVR